MPGDDACRSSASTPMTPVRRDEHLLPACSRARAAVSAAIVSRVGEALFAGAGIRAAAVDDDRAGAALRVLEMPPRDEHRRRLREVRREERRRRGWRVCGEDGEVERGAAALMPQWSAGGREPGRRREPPVGRRRWRTSRERRGVSHAARPAARMPGCGRRSSRSTAYWPQRRKCGQEWQSVTIFSGSHTCGTIENPSWTK